MPWTDLLPDPRTILGVYSSAPSLAGFKLEWISLGPTAAAHEDVRLRGDFAALPEPLPPRWSERGYERASVGFSLSGVTEARVDGVPQIRPNGHAGFEGAPVDLQIERDGQSIIVSGMSDYLTFRFVCSDIRAHVEGQQHSAY